ncbi:dihydrofolate reductase family protein [Streptosporangium roseum]|uniref:dihydrofolate reductase family protein n=1 Tax=Streptosporangium roseum TaxID=2001 RepID=UPI00331C6D70
MRKVVLLMHVSLDGFVGRSDGDLQWIFPDMDDDLTEWTIDSLRRMDTHVLGRVNYEEQSGHWPYSTDRLAPLINNATKIVFSGTLEKVEWNNSRLATGDVTEEIAQLKQRPGTDIFVPGGARFAQSVSRLGLVDEYRLIVHPLVLGSGLPLFTDPIDLKLLSSREFSTGAVALTYRRA